MITGKGSYTGTKTASFQIARAKAVLTAKATALTLTQSSSKTAVIKSKKTDGKITCKSSNSKIVKISGTSIIPVSPGQATVTIQAAQGVNYKAASAKIRHHSTSTDCQQCFSEVHCKRPDKYILETGKICYRLSDSVQHFKQLQKRQNNYRQKQFQIYRAEEIVRWQKILHPYPHIQNGQQKNYYSTWSKTSSVKVK